MTIRKLPARLACAVFPIFGVGASVHGQPTETARTIKVAAISFVPTKLDLAGNAARLADQFRRAAAGGARLAVAPEASLDAYIAIDIIQGKEPPERMHDMALTLDSPVIRGFQSLARELQLCLVFGFAERVGSDVYDAALFIDDRGRICGDYHKMQLAEGTNPGWWFDRVGAQCRAFQTPLGRCGILICNDRWNPDLAKVLGLDGAELIVIPTDGEANDRNDRAVLDRARENAVPIVQANQNAETLIIDHGHIVASDRKKNVITFGEVTIPPVRQPSPRARDAVEAGFLLWREKEMPLRYRKFMDKVQGEHARKS